MTAADPVESAAAEDGRSSSVDGFFRGVASLESLAKGGPAEVRMNRVSFETGARTIWHSHEGGQLLVVVEGDGVVATHARVELVAAGDVVWTPPGQEHWHGATDGNRMVHVAVSLGTTLWGRPVDTPTETGRVVGGQRKQDRHG